MKPLLPEGNGTATAAVRAVDRDLSDLTGAGTDEVSVSGLPRSDALATLLPAYLELTGHADDGMERCGRLVDSCIDAMAGRAQVGLFGGWAGIGWLVGHLGAEDEFVEREVSRNTGALPDSWPRRFGYDLISGLVGVGVHFVERLPDEAAREGLVRILDELERTAVEAEGGVSWFTAADLLPEWQRKRAPQGYYNLGVAHGVPGVMWLLGKLCARGVEADRARTLLEGSLRWLLAAHPDPGTPDLPSWIAPGVRREPNRRMAWCYGPLGAAAVVWEAAREGGDSAGEEWGRTMSFACAGVEPSESGNRDAALCHGAAGNAHIFHRLYRRTGDERFREAALAWFDEALTYRKPGVGVGGFQAWAEVDGKQGFVDDASFLGGSAGIGLALLAAITDTDPAWDRLLLLS